MVRPSVLMVGTGEYTTGYVHNRASGSDKSAGVVALSLFDMRRRGKVGRLMMAGTNGSKFPGIRRHLHNAIARVYKDLDVTFQSFPDDDVPSDPKAYLAAMDRARAGRHRHGVHAGRYALRHRDGSGRPRAARADRQADRQDARRASHAGRRGTSQRRARGDGSAQAVGPDLCRCPRSHPPVGRVQLLLVVHEPAQVPAGDVSLLGRQVERHQLLSQRPSHRFQRVERCRTLPGRCRSRRWRRAAWRKAQGIDAEDTITLGVQWENIQSGSLASAFYTASWIAPKSDVHSQQRFYYLGQKGEVQIDQAHRGYSLATDAGGFSSPNPLFMKYTPDAQGYFSGQSGYGYRSIEAFVDAVAQVRAGSATPADFRGGLATVDDTVLVTAILEAGRRSLDSGGMPHQIEYAGSGNAVALSVA